MWRERIWPRLGAVKLSAMVEASGHSKGHCSVIRAGRFTPHVSTWPAFAKLVGVEVLEGTSVRAGALAP